MADNLRVNWSHSPSKVRFSWKQKVPLRAQSVYVSASYADVAVNCTDRLIPTNCIVKNNNVPVDKEEYLIDRALFEGGRPYYFKVAGAAVPACGWGRFWHG